MWLIHTHTLELREFIDANSAPRYAILSHCWSADEIPLGDFRKKRNCYGTGYEKIINCCAYARNIGYKCEAFAWIWIDTW